MSSSSSSSSSSSAAADAASAPAVADEEKIFREILRSMGVTHFDPMVVMALNEYTRRLASEIICDAKDYSVHIGKERIDSDDIRTAIQLSQSKLFTSSAMDGMEDLKHEINSQNVVTPEPLPAVNRYPPSMFPNVSVTYCSGSDAYDSFLVGATDEKQQ